MEGPNALEPQVQAFSERAYEINNCKRGFSAFVKLRTKYVALMSTNSGHRMISLKIKLEDYELAEDLKNRPCIEIPADWSNEKAEMAINSKGALCIELWGNRRMLCADPDHAADLGEQVTGRREDPSEQAWTAGPWPRWMSAPEAESSLRNIPWEIEVVLGSLKTTKDGVDIRMLKVIAKELPKNILKVGDKWLLVIDKVTIYITKCENRWPLPFESPK